VSLFPLQRNFVVWGVWAAVIGGALFQSALAALAFLLLFVCGGAVWRRGESFLAYCLAFQWMEFVTGFLYQRATGSRADPLIGGDLEGAVLFSLVGLIALTLGLRVGMRIVRPWTAKRWDQLQQRPSYDIRKLFWCSIVMSLFNSFVAISPMAVWFEAAQIITNLLMITGLFLPLLLFTVVRTGRGYHYAVIAMLLAWLPSLASHMSAFSGIFLTILIVLTSEWRPWEWRFWARLHSKRVFRWSVLTAALLIFLAVFWTGGMKRVWRPRILSGEVSGRPIDKAMEFISTAFRVLPQIDPERASRDLVGRLASATDFFGVILTRVPAVVDHEDGKLTMRALYHITHPRILFPEKLNLASDSPMVIKYAGVSAAGNESGTSVGIGYMAEFYVDFGAPWMWLAVFMWGFIVGVLYNSITLFVFSYDMYRAVAFSVLAGFSGSGGDIAKDLGGILQGWIIVGIVFLTAGRAMHQWLLDGSHVSGPRLRMSTASARTL
jgi:hypothetical protein